MLIERNIYDAVKRMIPKYPIIALTGPRQSGKTTLLRDLFSGYRYVSLENLDHRNFALNDPNGFLEEFDHQVIFDEVQRVPELFSYLQTRVDNYPERMGSYVLSGSQNFHLMHSITQSLAGRVAIFKLFPLDHLELNSAGLLQDEFLENLVKGYYPAIYHRDIPSKVFYANYIQTYIHRDVSELIAIREMRLFQNFLSLCATRAGQLLNLNALANECGITQPTAKAWLSALEQSFITFQLYPYYKNFSKRILKTPKLYFYDTGLLCHLLKATSTEKLLTHPFKGVLFENMMVAEYVKQMHHSNDLEDIWYWRDSGGNEVDLLVDKGLDFTAFEFKATKTITSEMFNGLNKFEAISKIKGLEKKLVYAGNENQVRTAGKLVSWKDFPN